MGGSEASLDWTGAAAAAGGNGAVGGPESLYSITFVENSGNIPPLGARYQWEFTVGSNPTPTGEFSCMDNYHVGDTAGTAPDVGVVPSSCVYSVSDVDGAFDSSTEGGGGLVGYSFYMQEL